MSDAVKDWPQASQTNAVLSGLSGPDLGVDKWLVCDAQKMGIPTYSLQDYPG